MEQGVGMEVVRVEETEGRRDSRGNESVLGVSSNKTIGCAGRE